VIRCEGVVKRDRVRRAVKVLARGLAVVRGARARDETTALRAGRDVVVRARVSAR